MKQFGNLMKQAKDMQVRLQKLQEDAGSITVEASAGGGMVTAVANGRGELVSVKIEKDVVNPEDVAMLEDLIVAAGNEALRKAREAMAAEMSKLTGGMSLPGLF